MKILIILGLIIINIALYKHLNNIQNKKREKFTITSIFTKFTKTSTISDVSGLQNEIFIINKPKINRIFILI